MACNQTDTSLTKSSALITTNNNNIRGVAVRTTTQRLRNQLPQRVFQGPVTWHTRRLSPFLAVAHLDCRIAQSVRTRGSCTVGVPKLPLVYRSVLVQTQSMSGGRECPNQRVSKGRPSSIYTIPVTLLYNLRCSPASHVPRAFTDPNYITPFKVVQSRT